MHSGADSSLRALTLICVMALMGPASLHAQDATDLFELSLEELMSTRVLASLTSLPDAELPASITVITAEDIRLTPARNLLDLIETYVPGAIWMNRETGPVLGIRGSIVDWNYKYLLLVNGRLINSKAHFGAKSELEQWDLSDIRRIDVIRGPGSVVHGPGAVAGVISITTYDVTSAEGGRVAAHYGAPYSSFGASVRKTISRPGFRLFAFASATRTPGDDSPHYLVQSNDQLGYVGEDVSTDTEALDYFADYNDTPQIKLHVDSRIGDSWRVWARYTQQGSTWRANEAKSLFDGELVNQQGARDRRWTAFVEHVQRLSPTLTITSSLGAGSFDGERRHESVGHPERNHALNVRINYAESEISGRILANWRKFERFVIAVGGEYAFDQYGPGWGDDARDMRLGGQGNVVSGPDSHAMSDPSSPGYAARGGSIVTFAGDGWSTHSLAMFGEANVALTTRLRALFSGRFDKTTHAEWLFSPRMALIADVGAQGFLKFTAQESHRINTASEIFVEHRNGMSPSSESVTALELAYSRRSAPQGLNWDFAAFWNDAEVISWDEDINKSLPVGRLKVGGIEGSVQYQRSSTLVGVTYAFAKQLDWELAPSTTRSGVSYSDYDQPLRNSQAVQKGYGNDLNNWPNHSFKAFVRTSITDRLRIHLDSRVTGSLQGAKDGLEGLRTAVAGLPEQADVDRVLRTVTARGVYGADFRVNGSLTYSLPNGLGIQLYAQNLVGFKDNKRYALDQGNDRTAPRRIRYIEEPRTVGVRLSLVFD